MKVLITGGGGVIGTGVIPALLEAGHTVRLLGRSAEHDAFRWPKGVEPFQADVGDPTAIAGAAEGCDAILHIAGIAEEAPPEQTYDRVNVGGTRTMVAEAERAGRPRFVFVSSLGADRGSTDYHRSKREAEAIVRNYGGEWTILRPGNVYGPGDEVITLLLRMVRVVPTIPVVDDGDQRFQPVYYRDIGRAVVCVLERNDLVGRVLELAGNEVVTMNDLVDLLSDVTGQSLVRLPLPSSLVSLGASAAETLGLPTPLTTTKLTMLLEENFIGDPDANALVKDLGVTPTSLADGLRLLADELPEQLPSEGVGEMERKRYWADITGSRVGPEGLLEIFKSQVSDVMPIDFDAEPGVPKAVRNGLTLTAALPPRGTIQIRVVECHDRRVTFATVQGHPLAGVVRFHAQAEGAAVRFEVETLTKSATTIDYAMMRMVGSFLQDQNWSTVVERMVERSGGTAPDGVRNESVAFDDVEANRVQNEIEELVARLHREGTVAS